MANLELKDMFEKERFPKANWQFISLMFYCPVGFILSILRFFIGLNACLTALLLSHVPLVRSIVLRLMCLVLGITVKQDNKHQYDKSARVIVANCVTRFDYIALHLVTGCVTSCKWGASFFDKFVPGVGDFNDSDLSNLRAHVEKGDSPLLIHPEGTTSPKKGLLKFGITAASITRKVQPVAVFVYRPSWANTAPTVLGASATQDLFWFLFSPYTVFRIKYLNVVTQEADELPESFADKMQKSIARSLSLPATSFSASDKAEYEKRYLHEMNHPVLASSPLSGGRNPELVRMTLQVAEVLPNVPHEAIFKDLNRTWSVETTISNILEGVVQYTPINLSQSSVSQPSRSTLAGTSSEETASSQKPNDWNASKLTFAERKAQMIQEARRRYILKNNLSPSLLAETH